MLTGILRKPRKFLIDNIIYILWVLLSALFILLSKSKDCVVFFDVGQGDATLIQEGDFQILIDGGPDESILYELPKYMPMLDKEIEVVILTHPHEDHVLGILYLLENYSIGELWYYPVCYSNSNYEYLLDLDMPKREIHSLESITVGHIYMDILWPKVGSLGKCGIGKYASYNGDINDDSVVISVQYLNRSFLLMGDAQSPVDREIVKDVRLLNEYSYLKVGHHCSKNSKSETILKNSKVTNAICSCSEDNMFGHPDDETLGFFSNSGVQIYTTYKSGNIVVF